MTCLTVLALKDLRVAQAMWKMLSPHNHVLRALPSLLPVNNQLSEPASLIGVFAQSRRLPTHANGVRTDGTVGKPRSSPQPSTYRSQRINVWCCSTPARWVSKTWVPTVSFFKTNCKGPSESCDYTLPRPPPHHHLISPLLETPK